MCYVLGSTSHCRYEMTIRKDAHLFGIPKRAFVRSAMQLLSVTVQPGNAEMYRRSDLIISREQGLRYDAGFKFAVPVLLS